MNYPDHLHINTQKKVLCVGLLCVDIVSSCEDFPAEGTDQNCVSMHWQKGGNAANSSAVLGILKQNVDYMGSVAKSNHSSENVIANFVRNQMEAYGVCLDHVAVKQNQSTPCSQVVINLKTGSRTIIHSRNSLPELTFEEFKRADTSAYTLVHFEGRNVPNVLQMIKYLDVTNQSLQNDKIIISMEAEKPKREDLFLLMPFVDILVISQEFARARNHENAVDAVKGFKKYCKPGAFIVCPWGDAGAASGIVGNSDDNVEMIPAHVPSRVVDTLGAGDTFIGALLSALIQRNTLTDSVRFACSVAGHKVSSYGYDHLRNKNFHV